MYTDNNDIRTPRERIEGDFLRRMLESSYGHSHAVAAQVNDTVCCERGNYGLTDYPLAMVYAPVQQWRKLYDNDTALCRGTLFKELDLPFLASDGSRMGGGCCRG